MQSGVIGRSEAWPGAVAFNSIAASNPAVVGCELSTAAVAILRAYPACGSHTVTVVPDQESDYSHETIELELTDDNQVELG